MIAFLRKMWTFVRPYRTRFIAGLICGALYGMANGVLIGTVRVVIQLIFEGETNFHQKLTDAPAWIRPLSAKLAALMPEISAPAPENRLEWLLIVTAIPAVMVLRNLLQYLSIYFTSWSAMTAIGDIRTKLFAHLQNLSLGFFNKASTGDLIARVTSDTQVLYAIIANSFSSAVKDPISIVVLVLVQFTLQPTLTLVSIIVFPVCIVPIIIYGRKVRKSAKQAQKLNAELSVLMHESFTGNRVIKAYNLEETVSEQFRATVKKFLGQMMRVVRANEIPSQLMEIFGALGISLVFFYILGLPKEARPNESDFMAFILSVVMIYPSIKSFTRMQNQVHQARAASERIFELLATVNSVPEPAAPKMLHADKADIEFQNLDFSYGDRLVLQNISFNVKAGQLVAFVGETGSGKTTLANLLLRFYDPTSGVIKIGGVDIREVSTRDLRNQIAVVAQENILFNDTVRRNIELGRLGASNDDIIAAARFAKAYDFIMQRPDGFDTVVGEKGVTLSGGQRQRIAIARAVLRNAPILVLDEATNALDAEVERQVQAELDALMKGRTTFCIAHRLSTILHADMIVVLDQGRIAEMGKHEELVKRGGIYQKLHSLQFKT